MAGKEANYGDITGYNINNNVYVEKCGNNDLKNNMCLNEAGMLYTPNDLYLIALNGYNVAYNKNLSFSDESYMFVNNLQDAIDYCNNNNCEGFSYIPQTPNNPNSSEYNAIFYSKSKSNPENITYKLNTNNNSIYFYKNSKTNTNLPLSNKYLDSIKNLYDKDFISLNLSIVCDCDLLIYHNDNYVSLFKKNTKNITIPSLKRGDKISLVVDYTKKREPGIAITYNYKTVDGKVINNLVKNLYFDGTYIPLAENDPILKLFNSNYTYKNIENDNRGQFIRSSYLGCYVTKNNDLNFAVDTDNTGCVSLAKSNGSEYYGLTQDRDGKTKCLLFNDITSLIKTNNNNCNRNCKSYYNNDSFAKCGSLNHYDLYSMNDTPNPISLGRPNSFIRKLNKMDKINRINLMWFEFNNRGSLDGIFKIHFIVE